VSAATIPCGARGAKMDPLGVLGVDWRLPSEGGVEGFPRVLIEIRAHARARDLRARVCFQKFQTI